MSGSRTSRIPVCTSVALLAGLLACEPRGEMPFAAVAVLHATDGSDAEGIVRFEATPIGGVRVESDVSGLSPGTHAYHVHVFGDCSAPDASSAGDHFDFIGWPGDSGQAQRILGNLGELVADDEGAASHDAEVAPATLSGPRSIIGRSVVVHARGNDPAAAPLGAAGERIACGVIGVAQADDPAFAQR